MFGYVSLLVENDFFDEIQLNFLIVGHTHASIDQYFSVLSNKISKTGFIATPEMLAFLVSTAHNDISQRPLVVRKLCVFYDVAGFWEDGNLLINICHIYSFIFPPYLHR
jgi:hypothetical protein